MPLLDVEKLFVYRSTQETVRRPVKNTGSGQLMLLKVYAIGECESHVHIDVSEDTIKAKGSTYITVKITGDYWKPAAIRFDTNCKRAGQIIYVLRFKSSQTPNLWLLPSENCSEDQVFFQNPEPYLQLPLIVQSDQHNPLKFSFCPIESEGEDASEDPGASREVVIYSEETGRKISFRIDEQRYQILNSQKTPCLCFVRIYFPPAVIDDKLGEQAIRLKICTNSQLSELETQEISMTFAKIEVIPIVKRDFRSRLWKKQIAELKIKNLGTHPVRIFGIPIDPDKIRMKYPETNRGKTSIDYPIVIPEKRSRKIGITIKLSFKEWLWSGMDVRKVSLPIFANGAFDPKNADVFASKVEMQNLLPSFMTRLLAVVSLVSLVFLISLVALAICGIAPLKFLSFSQSTHDVFVSSEPQGQRVIVDVIVDKDDVTTPTLLKLDADAEIQIGDSGKRRVRDVLEDGHIFFPNERWDSQTEEKK